MQSLAPPTPRMSVYYASWTRRLGFAHYDAYTVASTDYAASYIAPTGASPMGQLRNPLGQGVYRAMKQIREEILNRCSSIEASYVVHYTSLLSPPVGVRCLCTRPPCTIKGGHPLEKDSSPAGQMLDSFILREIDHTVDVGYYAPAARTTLNVVCSCVLAPELDRPNSLAIPRVLPLRE